jgi:hypothetical protein
MKTTIDMAHEVYGAHTEWTGAPLDRLEQLVAIVRADERALAFVKLEQRVKEAYQDGHTAGTKSEREACAKVCDDLLVPVHISLDNESFWEAATLDCADAIRARGNT